MPNKIFTNSPLTNIDRQQQYYIELRLKLHHSMTADQIERAMDLIQETLGSVETTSEDCWLGFADIEPGYYEIEL